jgi:signal transduction histidine kinase
VQKICEELRPVALDDLGLLPAIEWQVQEFQRRTDIDCYFISQADNLDELDSSCALCLYRIVQEGLTNIIRHAEATKVIINLRRIPQRNMIELIITDNGRGIKKAEIKSPKSFGLIGMRERLVPFGGKLSIKGIEGKGTTLTVYLPFIQKKVTENG